MVLIYSKFIGKSFLARGMVADGTRGALDGGEWLGVEGLDLLSLFKVAMRFTTTCGRGIELLKHCHRRALTSPFWAFSPFIFWVVSTPLKDRILLVPKARGNKVIQLLFIEEDVAAKLVTLWDCPWWFQVVGA